MTHLPFLSLTAHNCLEIDRCASTTSIVVSTVLIYIRAAINAMDIGPVGHRATSLYLSVTNVSQKTVSDSRLDTRYARKLVGSYSCGG